MGADGMLLRDEVTYIPVHDPRALKFGWLCHLAKNLWNACLYDHRQRFFADNLSMDPWQAQRVRFVAENNPDYRALPAKVAGETVQEAGRAFKAFFAMKKAQREGRIPAGQTIRIPGYLPKDGMRTISFPRDAIGKNPTPLPNGLWEHTLCPKELNITITTTRPDIAMVRISPAGVGFRLHVLYKEEPLPYDKVPDQGRYAGIDLGVDNLMAVFVNVPGIQPLLVDGHPVKAINQWYNKVVGKDQELLADQYRIPNKTFKTIEQARKATGNAKLTQDPRATRRTRRMRQATEKRKHQLDWHIGSITTFLANYLASIGVSRVVIGLNPDWKQNANMGRTGNQRFVQIPYRRIIDTLTYKLAELGIPAIETEESYTSKASFPDHDRIGVYGKADGLKYSGHRVGRGRYRTGGGTMMNADVNGAANIMRKVIPDAIVYAKGVEALAVGPVRRVRLTKNGTYGFARTPRFPARS